MIWAAEEKFSQIKWLNMNLKTNKEYKKRGNIVLLFEIITNSIYWQGTYTQNSIKSGSNF
jgi:acyl-ACP thioesterase